MAISSSASARDSSELTSLSNDTIFGGFGSRTIDIEVRNCRLFVDGDIGVSSGGSASLEISNQPLTGDEILNRYYRLGEEFLRDLKGGFRLCLWDRHKQRLIVAVDPFATKPVYFFEKDGILAIAGKVSGLIHHPSFDREIDPNVLFFYLNHSYVPAPYSIYRNARRLQPGEYLLWQKKGLTVSQYWDIDYTEDFSLTENAAATKVYAGVEQALRFSIAGHGQASNRLGAFLSGGTDSSTLVGLLAKVQSLPAQTFSVGFTERAYNEIEYARIAAKHFGTQAHEYFVSADDTLKAMPVLASSFDEPFGNSSAIPTYFCLRTAKEAGITTMLAGDGGDELFGGNERYLSERMFFPYDRLSPRLQELSVSLGNLLPKGMFPFSKVRRYLERASEPNPDRYFYYQLFLRQYAGEYFTSDFLEQVDSEFALTPARLHYSKISNAAPLNRLLYMDLKMCIADNDLFKVNRMAEALDIKVCYPYLDRDLAESTGRIPASLKLKGTKKRYIFKQAFQKLLPQEILRKTKHGFGLPVAGWIRQNPRFNDFAKSLLLDGNAVGRGYFRQSALESLFVNHARESSDFYGTYIWHFMMLELWHRTHGDLLEAAPAEKSA
jgi:asparagine synthase (glutamine-hydrolysing)